jgi:histidinol-phosphate/aromatic aminotransferase/cobyric acid decarboxylase-like protein
VLVRTCTDFAGLDDRFLRLAVRSAADNRRLLAELARLF